MGMAEPLVIGFGAPFPPFALKEIVTVRGLLHTAYRVADEFAVYVPPAEYVALVTVLLVDQPRKVYPVLVGIAVDSVRFSL